MPHAIKLHEELGKHGLVVILNEVQGSSEIPAFMMKKFSSNECIVTKGTRVPVKTSARGIPRCALIGVDGTLLVEGLNGKVGGKLEDLIRQELQKARRGWGATKDIRKARQLLYGKKDIAGAWKLVRDLDVEGQEAQEDLQAVRSEVETRFNARVKSVEWLIEQGRWLEARQIAGRLVKAVSGVEDWEARAKELEARFDTKEARAELAMDKKLTQFLQRLKARGPKGGEEALLRKLAKSGEGTSVGARAARLAEVIEKANSD